MFIKRLQKQYWFISLLPYRRINSYFIRLRKSEPGLFHLVELDIDRCCWRSRIYEAIVKGEQALSPGIPESFNVLVKELQGLCLDIRMEKAEGTAEQKEQETTETKWAKLM